MIYFSEAISGVRCVRCVRSFSSSHSRSRAVCLRGLLSYNTSVRPRFIPQFPLRYSPHFRLGMVAPGLRLSERPNLEKYIKDGKLMMPYNFPFHKQPTKGLYIIYQFILFLFILPLWVLRYALPSWRPRKSWTIGQAVGVRAHSHYILSFLPEDLPPILYFIREEPFRPPVLDNWREDRRVGEEA